MPSTKFQLLQVLLLSLFTETFQVNLCIYRTRSCPNDKDEDWTYRGSKGPSSWGITYPSCNGKYQSPIDIRTDDVEKDEALSPLGFKNYDQIFTPSKISNIRNRIELEVDDGFNRTITVNGETYDLWQLHFHWGCSCQDGSEHTVNGKSTEMEIQFVHKNNEGKTAVVAVFAKVGKEKNEVLQKINNVLKYTMSKGDFWDPKYFSSEELEDFRDFSLIKLLPSESHSYYRYTGSMTSPPCEEEVIWSVITKPISIEKAQIVEFRKLSSSIRFKKDPECILSRNFRPVQPLNSRTVKLFESQ